MPVMGQTLFIKSLQFSKLEVCVVTQGDGGLRLGAAILSGALNSGILFLLDYIMRKSLFLFQVTFCSVLTKSVS